MPEEILAGPDAPVVHDTAANPEAAQVNAATTDAQTDGAEGGEVVPAAPEKTFTQAELNEIVSKEKAKAEAKAERRVLRTVEKMLPPQGQPQHSQAAPKDAPPSRDQFANDEAWLDARDEWRDGRRDAKQAQERQQAQASKTTQATEKIYAQAQKIPGFDREEFDALPLTGPMAQTLIESEQAAQLMAYMASNPEDVARIAGMSPARQAAEIGKLEAKLAAVPTPKPSKAPTPIKPIGSGNTPITNLTSAGMDDYIAQRKKQGAAWVR